MRRASDANVGQVRIDESLKETVREIAVTEFRTITSAANILMREALQARGYDR